MNHIIFNPYNEFGWWKNKLSIHEDYKMRWFIFLYINYIIKNYRVWKPKLEPCIKWKKYGKCGLFWFKYI